MKEVFGTCISTGRKSDEKMTPFKSSYFSSQRQDDTSLESRSQRADPQDIGIDTEQRVFVLGSFHLIDQASYLFSVFERPGTLA